MFAYQLRLERPLAIARDLNRDRPLVGEDGLPAGTIAMIAGELGFCRSGWVAEVVGQLAAQRPLNQRLLEPSRRGLSRDAISGPHQHSKPPRFPKYR